MPWLLYPQERTQVLTELVGGRGARAGHNVLEKKKPGCKSIA